MPPLIVAEVRGRYAARPPLVVDCSVIAAVLFDEPNRDSLQCASSASLQRWYPRGAPPAANR